MSPRPPSPSHSMSSGSSDEDELLERNLTPKEPPPPPKTVTAAPTAAAATVGAASSGKEPVPKVVRTDRTATDNSVLSEPSSRSVPQLGVFPQDNGRGLLYQQSVLSPGPRDDGSVPPYGLPYYGSPWNPAAYAYPTPPMLPNTAIPGLPSETPKPSAATGPVAKKGGVRKAKVAVAKVAKKKAAPPKSRAPRMKERHVNYLLNLVEEHRPNGGMACWNTLIAPAFAKKFKDIQRDGAQLRQKYTDLKNAKPPTGDPNPSKIVRRAKQLAWEICQDEGAGGSMWDDDAVGDDDDDDDDDEDEDADAVADAGVAGASSAKAAPKNTPKDTKIPFRGRKSSSGSQEISIAQVMFQQSSESTATRKAELDVAMQSLALQKLEIESYIARQSASNANAAAPSAALGPNEQLQSLIGAITAALPGLVQKAIDEKEPNASRAVGKSTSQTYNDTLEEVFIDEDDEDDDNKDGEGSDDGIGPETQLIQGCDKETMIRRLLAALRRNAKEKEDLEEVIGKLKKEVESEKMKKGRLRTKFKDYLKANGGPQFDPKWRSLCEENEWDYRLETPKGNHLSTKEMDKLQETWRSIKKERRMREGKVDEGVSTVFAAAAAPQQMETDDCSETQDPWDGNNN